MPTPPEPAESATDGLSRRRLVQRGLVAGSTVVLGASTATGTDGSRDGSTVESATVGTRTRPELGRSESRGRTQPDPAFHCSYVSELGAFEDAESARVTFRDGSFVASGDGVPDRLGSPGRVVQSATVDGTTFENPDRDCDPGQKATTFTCRSVTVRRAEFTGSFGDAPSPDAVEEFVLFFADGTVERRTPPLDPTGTFAGTGENEGKKLAAVRLVHAAFRTVHVWRNPNVESDVTVDR